MKIVCFKELPAKDQNLLRETVERLPRSFNKVSNPQTSAIVLAQKGHYFGNNIFLSNCTLLCAEANAIAASVAADDKKITKLYLALARLDSEAPKLISPCGNCRQMLHDFARLSGSAIQILTSTNRLEDVLVTDSDELLPEGFKSASLGKMAGEM